MTPPTILEVIHRFWRPWFRRDSDWVAWFVVLKAVFDIAMTPDELVIYTRHSGRQTPPQGGCTQVWLRMGRRAGKSLVMAAVAVYIAVFRDFSEHLVPGESALVQVLAGDRRQARAIFRYAVAMLSHVPELAGLVVRETDELIELSNGISIEITTSSARTVRGYTVCAALLDEIAHWTSATSTNPDSEVLVALEPSLEAMPGSVLFAASSPGSKRGVLYDTDRDNFGRDGPMLVWRATTMEMRPGFPERIITRALALDPQRAGAEWLAEYRSDLEQWLSRETVDSLIIPDRRVLPHQRRWSYKVYVDPSGGAADGFTLAVAHNEDGRGILDLLVERLPPFSPELVCAEYAGICREYGVGSVEGDRYGGQWVSERFSEHGITYNYTERTTSDMYREALPLFMGGKVELLDHTKLAVQLSTLERRVTRGAREFVSHPIGAHDDLATACCGALVAVAGQRDFIEMWKRLGGH
jgi:hypothetical protein